MNQEFGLIDSHKMAYHPEWVKRWLQAQGAWDIAQTIYPLYVEVSPVGQCNHRCSWCAVDYIGYKNRQLVTADIVRTFEQMTRRRRDYGEDWNGVKSVMFAGEGEPTLHPEFATIVTGARDAGIDVSITTNGSNLNHGLVDAVLNKISWIKVSLDGASPQTHAINHHADKEQFALASRDARAARTIGDDLALKYRREFDRIIRNISYATAYNRKAGRPCQIGAQLLINPTNIHETVLFVQLMREIGCDYCVVKPYSQHYYSIGQQDTLFGDFTFRDARKLADQVKQFNTDTFSVVFRTATMDSYEDPVRRYSLCQATPMAWGYIMATGEFVSCSAYLPQDEGVGDQRFVLGNVKRQSFQEIWEGDKRKENWEFVTHALDIEECRKNCRMEAVNTYLWGVRDHNPDEIPPMPDGAPRGVNFI